MHYELSVSAALCPSPAAAFSVGAGAPAALSFAFCVSACALRLSGPKNCAFSSRVWKRPWPNLLLVSMNFSSISSSAARLTWGTRLLRRVDDALLDAHHGALDHDVVLVDLSVVREAAQRG